MKNATTEVLATASALRANGRNHKEIMAETGLSHSQMERHFMAEDLTTGAISGGFWAQPESLTVKATQIAKARLDGESWGLISVRYQEPESRTRKHFAEASGLRTEGMRTGKGGAFLRHDPTFYSGGDRAKLGSELKAGLAISAQVPDPATEAKRVLPQVATVKKARAPRKAKVQA